MKTPLIPADVLARADKILLVSHFALGDFTYMQNYIRALAREYPHIKVHIWVDELRRTWKFWQWRFLKKYALYDWLEACPFIEKVYKHTYSPIGLRHDIKRAQAEHYPVVVSLSTLRPFRYIRLARSLGGRDAFVAGLSYPVQWYQLIRRWSYAKANALEPVNAGAAPGHHISDRYALWFEHLAGVHVPQKDRFPFINMPTEWITYAKLLFLKWGIDKQSKQFGRVIFINPFAKSGKRSWPLEHVLALIVSLRRKDEYGDVSFVINVVPEALKGAKAFFSKHSLNNTFLFSAENNFFQLPAVLSLCDFVISVETSIMHFASALHVPVVALMRQKNPEWAPIDAGNAIVITTKTREGVVGDIPVAEVLHALEQVKPARLTTMDDAQKTSTSEVLL